MSRSSVAAVVADGLARAGVPRVFASYHASAALIDAVRARGLAVVETVGATAACVMAAVTAELIDAPGVALVSLAGGLAPVVDGTAHATRDRAGVIVISDDAADSRLLDPVVKASVVADAASSGHWIAHAAQAAMADPRGAVHVAITDPEAPALPIATAVRRAALPAPPADALDALADSIARAGKPVIVAGLETGPDDAKWLRALAESVPAPVLMTPKGKGALPDPHPLALGLLAAGHPLLTQSDLLLVVGVDPVEVGPGVWPAGVSMVRVGRAPHDDAIVGEIALVIEELAPRLRGRTRADWDVAALDRLKRGLRAVAPARARDDAGGHAADARRAAGGGVAVGRAPRVPRGQWRGDAGLRAARCAGRGAGPSRRARGRRRRRRGLRGDGGRVVHGGAAARAKRRRRAEPR
ncbi:MAG: hypothetical protein DMD84_07660, partial [Candidatus Rokuibacteriota bacterium]